jgi:tetratricopeptide (TPR) repeat protein
MIQSPTISAAFAFEAQQHLERGDAATAITLCRQGLMVYPHYGTAYLVLARALLAIGDYTAADHAIERGIQSAPRLVGLGSSFGSLRKKFLASKRPKRLKQQPSGEEQTDSPSPMKAAALEAASALRDVETAGDSQSGHEAFHQVLTGYAPNAASESADNEVADKGHASESLSEAEYGVRPTVPEQAVPHIAPEETSNAVMQNSESPTDVIEVAKSSLPADTTTATAGTTDVSLKAIGGYLKALIFAHHEHDAREQRTSIPEMRQRTLSLSRQSPLQLRSNNLRLIPGLEFTSLRIERSALTNDAASWRGHTLPELPEPPIVHEPFVRATSIDEPNDESYIEATSDSADAAVSPAALKPESRTRSTASGIAGLSTVARFRVSDIEQSYPQAGIAFDRLGEELDDLARRLNKAQMPSVDEMMEREGVTPDELSAEEQALADAVAAMLAANGLAGDSSDTLSAASVGSETSEQSTVQSMPILASETMAKIYEAQGAHQAALQAYTALLEAATTEEARDRYQAKRDALVLLVQSAENATENKR